MRSRIALTLALLLALTSGAALAASDFDFDATVVCVQPAYVLAPIGGTVVSVPVIEGERVAVGDALAELHTVKLYAPADGTVTGIFCEADDSIQDVADRYGALMYIEPDSKYTLTASTDDAYNASQNKYIHVGEQLYLACSDGKHTGEGFVTAVDGTDFTIEVTDGSFYMGETVSAYRSSGRNAKSRVGRGEIARSANIAVAGPQDGGSVVAVRVNEGIHVTAGTLLVETLSGEYDGYYSTGSVLKSDVDGIVAGLNVQPGGTVNKGDIVATVYTTEGLQLEADINEADLSALSVGTPVEIVFNWNEDDEDAPVYPGMVSRILYAPLSSGNGEESSDTATYAAYIDFDADDTVRLGMTATVRAAGAGEEDEPDEEDEVDEVDDPVDERPADMPPRGEKPQR